MTSLKRGTGTSRPEIVNVSSHGVWLHAKGKEYFLPYAEYPWFRNARLSDLHRVKLLHGRVLHWEGLDVDLALHSLDHLDQYPLKYK
jgi:hypothetical protein